MGVKQNLMLGPSISRRQVVGGMLAATAAISTFSFGARAFADEAAEAPALTDGTYESVQPGVNGDVTVSVTIAEGKISDVQVTDSAETAGIGASLVNKNDEVVAAIGETPADLLPRLIVENNSIGLDSVTGATITSAAILNAVSDCIEQAGGDPEAFKTPVAYEARTDGAADVVVVGGGGAGLVAAIAAAQQGKTVAIIEKNGSCGGDTLVCGGIYNAPDEALQSKVEMTDAVKSTVEAALEMTSDDPDKQAALEAMQEPVQRPVGRVQGLRPHRPVRHPGVVRPPDLDQRRQGRRSRARQGAAPTAPTTACSGSNRPGHGSTARTSARAPARLWQRTHYAAHA